MNRGQVLHRRRVGRPGRAPTRIEVISPRTEEVIAKVPDGDHRRHRPRRRRRPRGVRPRPVAADVARSSAPTSWPRSRGHLQARYEEIARIITEEMGSPISFSMMGQVFAATMVLDYYAGLARELPVRGARARACSGPMLVRREPVGVVGAIVPWNVPLFVTMLEARARRWSSGCTVVLKPSPETPLDAYLLAEVGAGGRAARRAWSTSSRPAARSASTSSPTPASTRSPSPGRPRRAARSPRSAASSCKRVHPRARRQVGGDHPRRRRPRRPPSRA